MTVPFAAYQALVTEIIALKRDGFLPPEQYHAAAPSPVLDGEIAKAIAEIAEGNEELTHTLTNTAWTLVQSQMPPSEIATRIRDGEDVSL